MVGSVYCSRRHSISLRSYLSLSKKRHAISNFLVPIAEVLSYVANHESADLLYEEQVGDTSSTSNESGQDFVQFRSLSLD